MMKLSFVTYNMSFIIMLNIFAVVYAEESTFPTVTSYTKKDTINFRMEFIKALLDKSEVMVAHHRNTQSDGRAYYQDRISVDQRNFYVQVPTVQHCSYGPLFKENEMPVFKRRRYLTNDEIRKYEKLGPSYAYTFITDYNETDQVTTQTVVGPPSSSTNLTTTQTSYMVVNRIDTVYFTCDAYDFCCELYCCPRAVRAFLQHHRNESIDEHDMNSTAVFDRLNFAAQPHVLENATEAAQCRFKFQDDDYFVEKGSLTAIYYQCPPVKDRETECCRGALCCLKEQGISLIVVLGVIAGILLLIGIVVLIYCCCCAEKDERGVYQEARKGPDDL